MPFGSLLRSLFGDSRSCTVSECSEGAIRWTCCGCGKKNDTDYDWQLLCARCGHDYELCFAAAQMRNLR